MNSNIQGSLIIAGALLAGALCLPAVAQDTQTTQPTQPAAAVTSSTNTKTEAPKPAATAEASGIADVLKMLDAGVSKDVVKAYVENSAATYNLSSTDVIALKERGVGDDITMVLLKKSSDARAQAAQVAAATTAPPAQTQQADSPKRAVRYLNSANLNPESEEYFQYYYLYPRTLANVYQTLGTQPYPNYGYGYGYGYYPSMYVGPRFANYGQVRPFYHR